ncbi:hypothetical protein ACJX0J_018833, partial [Zea mays]
QFHHILAPPSSDPGGNWSRCKSDPGGCSATQIATLQGLRSGIELQDTWFAPNSPSIYNKKIAEVVGDWYFERGADVEIDCAYPCDSQSCRNLIPIDKADHPRLNFKDRYPEPYRDSHPTAPVAVHGCQLYTDIEMRPLPPPPLTATMLPHLSALLSPRPFPNHTVRSS